MKKRFPLLLLIVVFACFQANAQESPVSCYGKLKVNGNTIAGTNTGGIPVQVKGVSLGWTNTGWESAPYYNENSAAQFIDVWKAEIIRAAMGTEGNGGYQTDAATNKNRVKTVVNTAISKGAYVIIDWHAHNVQTEEAKTFFAEMADEFGGYDNVIFEIYNEPVGQDWNTIKAYANEIIAEIRKYSDNLVLVGTPFYSQYLHAVTSGGAVTDSGNNTAYVLHFYAATHPLSGYTSDGYTFQREIENLRENNLAVFISEWGSCAADGNGSVNKINTDAWHQFLDLHTISSCAWQASHKNEASAYFTYDISNETDAAVWSNTNNMRENGQYVYNLLQTNAQTAAWRSGCGGCDVKHTVTFDPGNGEAVTSREICDGNYAIALKAPVKQGFTFLGWYNGNTQYDFTTKVTGNLSLKAKWKSSPAPTLIADCENDNLTALCTEWFSYSDASDGGSSAVSPSIEGGQTFTMTAGGANETDFAAKMTYSLNAGSYQYEPFAGMGFDLKEDGSPVDLSSATGITFYHKGNSVNVKIVMASLASTGQEHFYTIPQSSSWQKITLLFESDFRQPDWVSSTVSLDLSEITQIIFQVSGTSQQDRTAGEVWIDQIQIDGIQLARQCISPCATSYSVTFEPDNEQPAQQQAVCKNDYAVEPEEPQKPGYIFDGWYDGDDEFNFAVPITASITLEAKWQKDTSTRIANPQDEIYLYPNPATQKVFISGIADQVNVAIYDLTGKIMKSGKINPNDPILLDVPKGIYFVHIKNQENVLTKQLIVE